MLILIEKIMFNFARRDDTMGSHGDTEIYQNKKRVDTIAGTSIALILAGDLPTSEEYKCRICIDLGYAK